MRDAQTDGAASEEDTAPGPCVLRLDDVQIVASAQVDPSSPIALGVRNQGSSLAWIGYAQGERRLQQLWQTASGEGTSFHDPSHAEQSSPAISATTQGFLTVWSERDAEGVNLRAQVSRDGELGSVLELTSGAGEQHDVVLASTLDAGFLLVWQATHGDETVLKAMPIAADGTPGAAVALGAISTVLGRPTLRRLGDGFVMAWVDGGTRNVRLQALDATGLARADSVLVDTEGDAQGAIDMATNDAGGALAFDVLVDGKRAEVRFRAFDLDARPLSYERVISNFPTSGLMPSLASWRGGYAVLYRSRVEGGPALGLALVSRLGRTLQTAELAPLVDGDLPLALRISPDGERLYAGWVDRIIDSASYQLSRGRVYCE